MYYRTSTLVFILQWNFRYTTILRWVKNSDGHCPFDAKMYKLITTYFYLTDSKGLCVFDKNFKIFTSSFGLPFFDRSAISIRVSRSKFIFSTLSNFSFSCPKNTFWCIFHCWSSCSGFTNYITFGKLTRLDVLSLWFLKNCQIAFFPLNSSRHFTHYIFYFAPLCMLHLSVTARFERL